jgi:parvulin-like peptidyl-prolyl isomerase
MKRIVLLTCALLFAALSAPTFAQTTPTVAVADTPAIVTSVDAQAAPDPGDVTAPPDNTWTIPYGSMISGGAEVISSVLLMIGSAILVYASKFLPPLAAVVYRNFLMKQGEQLLARAIEYGINATKDATKDKTLDINVGSQVIANAAEYATASGWKHLVDWLGGYEGLKQKVYARLDLEPNATPQNVGVQPVKIPAVMARS